MITCILITKEKTYPKKVLDSLQGFDEIIIETECPCIYRRYELALQAKNDLIYIQDDDCIIDWQELYKHYDGRLTNAITEHHRDYYKDLGMTLIGFGAFITKDMINFEPYLAEYDMDELFLMQTDRIFTYLNKPFNSVVMEVEQLPSSTAPQRMSTTAGHYENLAEVKKRLDTLPKTNV